jgi:anti-anti-sigma factor
VERSSGAAPPLPSGRRDRDDQPGRDLLKIDVEHAGNEVSIVALAGELDLATIPKLEERLREELRAHGGIVLDLTRLSFIDSSGIGLLIKTHRAAEGGRLQTIVSPGSQVERIFNLAGIDRALPLSDDRGGAVAALEDRARPSED